MNLENLEFGNAAGTVKSLADVERACESAMTEITVGSITMERREGNKPDPGKGRVYYYHPTEEWSLNSLGLNNMGVVEYTRILPQMTRMAHSAGKKLRVSVAGFEPVEYAHLAEECFGAGVDEVELNLGCPNVWGEGGQKPIASYRPELTASILQAVRDRIYPARSVPVKISPVEDREILKELLDMIMLSGIVSCIVGTNTAPNQERLAEDGSPALSFNDGNHVGGLAGSAIFDQAVEVMEFVSSYCMGTVDVKAVGGISSGETALKHLKPGVKGFQCATAYIEKGPRLFSRIMQELSELD